MLYSTLWKRSGTGYTLIEVLIVLAITGMLFFSAITVFGSQKGKTDFSQAMQDVSSKMQFYANQVTSGSYPSSDNYFCQLVPSVTGYPQLRTTSVGANSECLFLGQAIQALAGETTLSSYAVLGAKTLSGINTQYIDTAHPEPARTSLPDAFVLTDSYQLLAGSKVVSSTITDNPGIEYDMVGLYSGLPNDRAANASGTGALVLKAYPCSDVAPATPSTSTCSASGLASTSALTKCIEELSIDCNAIKLKTASQWNICFQSGTTNQKALLSIISAPGGISTKVSFVNCS